MSPEGPAAPRTAKPHSPHSSRHRHHRPGWRRLLRRYQDRYTVLRLRSLVFYAVALLASVGVAYGVAHCEMGADAAEP
jgi:hypothetical protein